MLENNSINLRTLTLLRITKKLIENTNAAGLYKLEKLIQGGTIEKIKIIKKEIPKPKSKEEIKEEIKQEVKEKLSYIPSKKIVEELTLVAPERKKAPSKKLRPVQKKPTAAKQPAFKLPSRGIPQQPDDLPENLRYLRPMKSATPFNIDLGKLNPLLQDNNVRTIETEGENEKVIVSGNMGRKPTGITLSREEIEEIIDKFSKQAKIPKAEGLFKVVLGNLILNAVISATISSRFIIKKM